MLAPHHLISVPQTHVSNHTQTMNMTTFGPWVPHPFDPLPILLHASPANENIASMSALKRNWRKANQHLWNTMTESLCNMEMDALSASPTTSVIPDAPNLMEISISAPSVAPPPMEPSPNDVFLSNLPSHLSRSLDTASVMPLHHFIDFLNHLTFNPVPITPNHMPYLDHLIKMPSPHDSDLDFSKIQMPYSLITFKIYLEKGGISDHYPELSLTVFPLEKFPLLKESFMPGNLASAAVHSEFIASYIANEVSLGRFSGPFSKAALESKIGFFHSSPIQVAVKPSPNGQKICCCWNLSYQGKSGHSVNDDIDLDKYPTHWGTASECTKIVHVIHLLIFISILSFQSFSFFFPSCRSSLLDDWLHQCS